MAGRGWQCCLVGGEGERDERHFIRTARCVCVPWRPPSVLQPVVLKTGAPACRVSPPPHLSVLKN